MAKTRVRPWAIKQPNSAEMIGKKTASVPTDSSSAIGVVREVWPDFLMAKVESYQIGTRIIPYLPETGIRKGSTVAISIFTNIPRITHKLFFGFKPDKTAVMNFDITKDSENKKYVYPQGEAPEWDLKEAAHLAYEPVIIKHEEGEKVYHVDFGGLKIGFKSVTLFYHPHARIELYKHTVDIIGISAAIKTKAGFCKYVFDESDKKSGYIVSTTTEYEDEEYFDFMREYKGNVSDALDEDKIEITQIPGATPDIITDSIYCMIIFDTELDFYENDSTTATHIYKNRHLSVEGGGDENVFHKKLMENAGIEEDSIEHSSGVAKIEDTEVAITYVKAISKEGDIFEFNAGEKTTVSTERKSIVMKEENTYVFGSSGYFLQEDYVFQQFPTKEETSYKYEYFGSSIREVKGDYIEKFFREYSCNKIKSTTTHDVDKESGIDTIEKIESPIVVKDLRNVKNNFSDDIDELDIEVEEITTIKNEIKETIIRLSTGEDAVVMTSSDREKECLMRLGVTDFTFKTENTMVFKSKKSIIFDSDKEVFVGKAEFRDGIYVDGDFIVNAENIYMTSEGNIAFTAKNIYSIADDSILAYFEKDFTALCLNTPIEDNKPVVGTYFSMSDKSSQLVAQHVQIYGGKDIAAVAEKSASYGAERTAIRGYEP